MRDIEYYVRLEKPGGAAPGTPVHPILFRFRTPSDLQGTPRQGLKDRVEEELQRQPLELDPDKFDLNAEEDAWVQPNEPVGPQERHLGEKIHDGTIQIDIPDEVRERHGD